MAEFLINLAVPDMMLELKIGHTKGDPNEENPWNGAVAIMAKKKLMMSLFLDSTVN